MKTNYRNEQRHAQLKHATAKLNTLNVSIYKHTIIATVIIFSKEPQNLKILNYEVSESSVHITLHEL